MRKILLAIDPGTVNFGYAVLKIQDCKITLLRCGMVHSKYLISEANTVVMRPKFQKFTRMFAHLLQVSTADCLVFERFIIQRRGLTGECVNQQIGAMVLTAGDIPSTQVMAATWKARMKKLRGQDLTAAYKKLKPIPAHPIDAVFQGLFCIEREFGIPITKIVNSRQILDRIQSTYAGVLEATCNRHS